MYKEFVSGLWNFRAIGGAWSSQVHSSQLGVFLSPSGRFSVSGDLFGLSQPVEGLLLAFGR